MGLVLPIDLERLAILRGCNYYEWDLGERIPPLSDVSLSNSELAVALVLPELKPAAREIRLAAALLGASDISSQQVADLAMQEHCVEVIRYIAVVGRRFEPENGFWQELLDRLPNVEVHTDIFPHPTRFVEMTGIDRGKVGLFTRWIRPRRQLAA